MKNFLYIIVVLSFFASIIYFGFAWWMITAALVAILLIALLGDSGLQKNLRPAVVMASVVSGSLFVFYLIVFWDSAEGLPGEAMKWWLNAALALICGGFFGSSEGGSVIENDNGNSPRDPAYGGDPLNMTKNPIEAARMQHLSDVAAGARKDSDAW